MIESANGLGETRCTPNPLQEKRVEIIVTGHGKNTGMLLPTFLVSLRHLTMLFCVLSDHYLLAFGR